MSAGQENPMVDNVTFRIAEDAERARTAAEALFEAVTRELEPMLPASATVLHVGATAVPGCLTKGDLDIVVRVDRGDFALGRGLISAKP
jgi:GrpB-like predicted nucleotidyltransferase (UPF0157 family)